MKRIFVLLTVLFSGLTFVSPALAFNVPISEMFVNAGAFLLLFVLFVGALFLLAMSILWFIMPLAIFGIKPLLKKIVAQNEAMMRMQRDMLPKPTIETIDPEDLD